LTRSRSDATTVIISSTNKSADIVAITDFGASLDLNKPRMKSCISPNLESHLDGESREKMEGSCRRTTINIRNLDLIALTIRSRVVCLDFLRPRTNDCSVDSRTTCPLAKSNFFQCFSFPSRILFGWAALLAIAFGFESLSLLKDR
jgi:hypothetical protein